MIKTNNVTGIHKNLFNLKLKIFVFFYFIPEFIKGNISLKRYTLFLKRLLLFLAKMQHNKFVKIGSKTRMNLYVPGFASKAFLTACKKFLQFENQMPCTTVLISITSSCTYHCSHCYQKLDKGKDVDLNLLIPIVKKLQDRGIAFFNIEGGEPFLVYDRLKSICTSIDERSEIWINSTGVGITIERLMELKKMNVTAIMFSLHSSQRDIFNDFMGDDSAWDTLESAIHLCHEAGLGVTFNSCLMKDDFYNGNFEKIMETTKKYNASLVQIIKPKPSGGWLEKEDIEFTQMDIDDIKKKVLRYNSQHKFKEYPSIFAQIIEEDKDVFGCTAGGIDRFYINAKGDIQPCEFLNISFGNIREEDFETIYNRMRNSFEWGGDCMICEKYAKEVREIFKDNHLSSLPLSSTLSEKIYGSWDRGDKTELYEKLEEIKG